VCSQEDVKEENKITEKIGACHQVTENPNVPEQQTFDGNVRIFPR
jgi:hypothetical protein